jgi:hypothetical protein
MLNPQNTQSTNYLPVVWKEMSTVRTSVRVHRTVQLLRFWKSHTSWSADISAEIPSPILSVSKQNSTQKARREGVETKQIWHLLQVFRGIFTGRGQCLLPNYCHPRPPVCSIFWKVRKLFTHSSPTFPFSASTSNRDFAPPHLKPISSVLWHLSLISPLHTGWYCCSCDNRPNKSQSQSYHSLFPTWSFIFVVQVGCDMPERHYASLCIDERLP